MPGPCASSSGGQAWGQPPGEPHILLFPPYRALLIMKLNKITIARKETPSGKILLNFRCNQTSQYIKDFCGTIKFILILGLFFFFFFFTITVFLKWDLVLLLGLVSNNSSAEMTHPPQPHRCPGPQTQHPPCCPLF
jgi:hypothetical protein